MEYRHLGKAGLKVSALAFGSWITFGSSLDIAGVKHCMRIARDYGVNFFDNAESYASGASEFLMGEALKDYRREDLVISTKIFWGGRGPNDTGLSWKHLVEGTKNSLRRLNLDYVDLLYCHRADPSTPIEETVRAIDVLIKQGLVFYWGTSEWRTSEIEAAHEVARRINATPPSMEQPEYNMFLRARVENEYAPLYAKYGMGTTIWSPLDSGILTGKYNTGIPKGSRLDWHEELRGRLTKEKIDKIVKLEAVSHELGCTLSQLAIAWCLKNDHVSSVITGAAHPQQVEENMHAIEVSHQLNSEVMGKINSIIKT
jgi:voltage-dependent potassium channel beta subunit